MGPVSLLLLLPSLLSRAQVTADFISGVTMETDNSTDSSTSSTASLGSPTSPSIPLKPASTMPSEPPTEEDDWLPAETFIYTGEPSAIEAAPCSRPYSPPGQNGSLPISFTGPLRPALDALANTANFLNMIFQASDLRESTVQEDMEWYHAQVRALLEADTLIKQALLTFDADPTAPLPQLVLRASRSPMAKVQTIVLQDLSKAWESLHLPAPSPDDSWFTSLKFPESIRPMAALSKRVLLNDLSTLDTPKWRQGDSYVTNRSGVRWASAPFLDCKDGYFVYGWMLTLSTSFYGLKPDLTPEFRGVIRVDVNIQDIDLDQCATGGGWFADTHKCNRTTMECVPIPGQGFRLGQYCCRCKEGYYNPEIAPLDSRDGPVNGSGADGMCSPKMPICLPCWPGCKSCQDGAPCWVQETWLLRVSVLAVQGVFMVLIFVSMLVAYRHRRNRRIRASGLLLLEMILFGSLLLYFPVFITYFKPSTFRCILLRWVRMLGFSIVYGTVTLKMYRVLKAFLSRTAQRALYMSTLHLLRILGVMLVTVSWFLCAWTVGVLQNRNRNIPVVITTTTSDGQGFNLCYMDHWDYMMAVAELLFLCWGSSLWTAIRPVPSAFHEPRYMGIAIHNELILSTMFHLFRFTFPSLHPDWMLLLSFTYTHVTITITLALLFVPKFLHVSKPGREEIATELYEDEVDRRHSGSYLSSSFRSGWSERSMDPDDFRDELKKLYGQLEFHKNKKMSAYNPHLSKKRSSRCSLGRSIIRRIVEIPEIMSRRCSRDEKDGPLNSLNGNQLGSFRSTTDTVSVSISYKSSMKTPSLSIRKSQSDHHCVRERESSLCESMLKVRTENRSSRQSETDSLDIPLGVCKSASAQNLTIDTNLLHPDHSRLHKTWSLTSTTSHCMENVSKVNRASTVLKTSKQNISISDQTRSALQSESFDKTDVCPWEVEPEHSVDKDQRHVTYANSDDDEEKSSLSLKAIICPWDHLPFGENDPSVDKQVQDKSSVSASAPGSPRPKLSKDQRAFSLRTATHKLLSVKSVMGSLDAGSKSCNDGNLRKEDSVSQKSAESASTASRSGTCQRTSMEKRVLQKRSMTATDGKPCLVKQNAIRLSSGESCDRSPRRLAMVKAALYHWDMDDMQKDCTYENVFLSRQNSKRSSISSWETASNCRTPSTHRRGSNRITPVCNVSHADVCPWDGTGGEAEKKQQSICPWESQTSERFNVYSRESHDNLIKQGSTHGNMCPSESENQATVYYSNQSRDLKTQSSLKQAADICPWETVKTPQPSVKQDNKYANVCPWDDQEKAEVVYENLNTRMTKEMLTVPNRQVIKPAAYPSASTDGVSNKQHYYAKPPVVHLGEQDPMNQTTECCPWDFPDPPKIIENICPWEEGNSQPTSTDLASQMTITVDICPWETGHQDKPDSKNDILHLNADSIQTTAKDSLRVNVCPWESQPPEKNASTKITSQGQDRVADVCPWDSNEPDSRKSETLQTIDRQGTAPTNVFPQNTLETMAVKAPNKQDSNLTEVCQLEAEKQKGLKKQYSSQRNSNRTNICPWETDEQKDLKNADRNLEDVCPWENEETKVAETQDSARADVCPWETKEPKLLTKQDRVQVEVCPWETEKPNVLEKQDSARADVCPWETDELEVVKKQDSTGAQSLTERTFDIPNRNEDKVTENHGTLNVEKPTTDVCTEQISASKENVALGRRDALCPWEMVRSGSGSFADNSSDVFTWEPENIPEEDEDGDAECAAEALVFPPDFN
ncbi:metabotropic glycine receptor [Brachionichthys hirsutus]|uniref:metabotropic glycine receptor n=1 Tax=Brachionichthys hirsutus TaxID=412623 RepID=UPI003604B4D7